jgi:PAS domain S-box-containing protein
MAARWMKNDARRRGIYAALLVLAALLILVWLADNQYQAGLVAETEGRLLTVERLLFIFRLTALVIVGLGATLAYFIASRQTRLLQTVRTQTAELIEQEARYRSVFGATSDGLVIRDMDTLAIVDANPAYCRLLQVTREAIIGQTTAAGIDLETYRQHLKIIERDGQYRWENAVQRSDGTTIHLEAVGTTIAYTGKHRLLTVLRDITESVQARQLLEQRVAKRTRELETLLEISHNLTSTLDLKPLLNLIVSQVSNIIPYSGAAVYGMAAEGQLELLLYQGPSFSDPIPRYWPLADFPIFARLIRSQQPVVIPDVAADTDSARVWQRTTGRFTPNARSFLGVPLIIQQQVGGMLIFSHYQPDYYTPHHATLALAFANQAAIAIENVRLYEQAQALASLEERRHLARELHDSVSQALYGIALGTRTARMLLDRDPTCLAEPLDYIMNLAEAGLSEMRALIFELRPEVLEAEGLVTALTKQAETLHVRHKLPVITNLGEEPDVSLTTKEALYRIAQEATHNIVKHANASQIELWLIHNEALTLEIKDNGQGFDPQQNFPGHLGLHSMRERAEKIGGSFQLESTPGQGTTIRVQVIA